MQTRIQCATSPRVRPAHGFNSALHAEVAGNVPRRAERRTFMKTKDIARDPPRYRSHQLGLVGVRGVHPLGRREPLLLPAALRIAQDPGLMDERRRRRGTRIEFALAESCSETGLNFGRSTDNQKRCSKQEGPPL